MNLLLDFAAAFAVQLQKPTLAFLERLLTEAGLPGWSIFPGGGKGAHGIHRAEAAPLVQEFAVVKFEVVLRDPATAKRLAETLTQE